MSTDTAGAIPEERTEKTVRPPAWVGRVVDPLVTAGEIWQLLVRVVVMAVRRPVGYWGEVRDQCYDTLKLTWFPMSLASFGFGFGAPGLTGGAIFHAFGIPYRLGSFFEFASIREFAPFICGMVVAGVMGTAITADIGARRVRDEIDAMEVLGVDPVRMLVLPRVLALAFMTAVLDVLTLVVGLASGWFAAGPVYGADFAAYNASLFDLLNTADIWGSVVKSGIFGLLIGIVATYFGLNTKGGSIGVGRAVNQSVVVNFAGIFVINFIFTLTLLGLSPEIQVYK